MATPFLSPVLPLASLPSPPSPVVFGVGPLTLTYYGLCIVLGIAAATWLTSRELARRGHAPALALEALLFIIPLGVAGARIYYVVANVELYAKPFSAGLLIWVGGLDIFGAVAGGFVGLLLFCWYRGISALAFADAAAPGVVLGQAVGRWGDYFNQELFGVPSGLPWAIRILPENRPPELADAQTFHPVFLYESIWNVLICLLLLWVARRFARSLSDGDVFLLYLTLYSLGYLLIVGTLRLDPTPFLIWGSIRGDLVVAGVLALLSTAVLVLRHSRSQRKHRPATG